MKQLYTVLFVVLCATTITNAQNVGIGHNLPDEKLDVDGNIKFRGGELTTGSIEGIVPFYIRGTGVNNNTNRVYIIGNTPIYNSGSRGLQLTIVNKSDLSVVSNNIYDTYASTSASDALATAINALTNGQIGVLTSYDAWEAAVTTNLDNAFKNHGLTKAFAANNNGTTNRKPYAAIFEGGTGISTAKTIEVLIPNNSAAPYAEIRGWFIAGSFVAAPTLPNALMNVDGSAVGLYVDENNNVNANGNAIQNVAAPTNGNDAANKTYVDGLIGNVTASDDWDLSGLSLYPKLSTYNVGIGNSAPGAYKLNVTGNTYISSSLRVSQDNTTGGGIILADDGDIVDMNDGYATHRFSYGVRLTNGNSSGTTVIQIANGIAGSGNTYFNTANNFGIGNNLPLAKFHVTGTSKFEGQMDMSTNKIVNVVDPTAAQDVATKNYVDNSDEWSLSGTDLYPKSTTYNVGIGNTAPGAFKLNVTGDEYLSGTIRTSQDNTTGGGIWIGDDGDFVDLNDFYGSFRFTSGLRMYNANKGGTLVNQLGNGTNPTYFNHAGNFGIGNNNPVGAKLDITGNLRTSVDGWNYMDNVTADSWNGLYFRSASNSFTEGGFILQQNDSEAGGGTTDEDVRFTIGVYNDFRQGGGHSDELWFQGGGRLVQNVGLWDSELNTIVGTPGAGTTGGYEWRVNNSNKMVLDHNGTLTLNNYTGNTRRPLYVDNNGTVTAGTGTDNSLWTIAMDFASSPDDLSGGDVLVDQDDAVANYNLPFTYTIEGVAYSNITISSNGWVAFGTVGTSYNVPTTLPSSNFSTPVIFPFWTDLKDFGSGEYVRAYSFGTSPNRVVIVHHRSKCYCSNSASPSGGDRIIEYQVQIHENGGINVKYITANPTMNGQQIVCGGTYNAAIGFQLSGGSNAKVFPISYNAKVLDDNRQPESWSVSPVK